MLVWLKIFAVILLSSTKAENIIDFLRTRSDLKQFLSVLQSPGLHKAYLDRQITIFVPTDKALLDYRGVRGEEFILNHLVNSIEYESRLGSELSSLVTGGPPIWITKRSAWIYFNQARAVERDIFLDLGQGEQQVVYIIDSVLEPLLPTSIRNASYSQDITAGKLLQRSTLYNLDNMFTRIFYEAAVRNKRDVMFDVAGRHTFFIPIDEAFKVVAKEYIDAKVVEAHIVPGQLLLTTLIPTQEYGTVAFDDDVKVNVSMQPSLGGEGSVMVRSNTIKGNRVHAEGLVVSRIVKGNIPVKNGIVHLIDKPLMIVARSTYDYLMEEGSHPSNRLYKFAQLVKDKGGSFGDEIRQIKQGTLLAPSNEAFRHFDRERLNYILSHRILREEFFGLHFTRERIGSNKIELLRTGDVMYKAPSLKPTQNIWFNFNPTTQKLTVEGRGVNATAVEKDIGTTNGVIHVIDRVLGVPGQTIAEKMLSDPTMSHSRSLTNYAGLINQLSRNMPGTKFTFIVPSNEAWEKVRRDFSQAFGRLTDRNNRDFAIATLRRHLIITQTNRTQLTDRGLTIEELVEKRRSNPSQFVKTSNGALKFTEVADIKPNAYKDYYVQWGDDSRNIRGKILRPNLECTNGYIHLIDTVLMDNQTTVVPWRPGAFSDSYSHSTITTQHLAAKIALIIYYLAFLRIC